MSDGFSQYQTSRLGVSAAKARAISERSQGTFDLGVTALEEKEALLRAEDQLQQIAKEAERNAAKRGRKAGFGRLIGSTIGFAIGGPAGKAALGTALGSLAGTAAAGGFKSYGVDVPDSLVPGGILYGRERDAFKQRAEDLEEAFDDLTDAQRQGIGKNVLTDYLTGRGLGKLGEAKVTEQGLSLDDLLERGDITNVDYLKNIFKSGFGGLGDSELEKLNLLNKNATPDSVFTNAMKLGKGANLLNLESVLENNLSKPFDIAEFTGQNFNELELDAFNLGGFKKKRNSLFQGTVGPMGGLLG